MLLTVCVNGARLPSAHPALSADPEVLARDASRAIAAGADEVHLHPKDLDGHDSLRGEDVARWLEVFRRVLPGVRLGVTTGLWAADGPAERLALVRSWETLPDLASVNWHEEGSAQLARHLLERGVDVEAGLWTAEAAEAWARSPLAPHCHRVLVELPDVPAGQLRPAAEGIRTALIAASHRRPLLLHGEERSAWPGVLLALEAGADTRIGLEDTLTGPGGAPVGSNAELLTLCREFLGG